MTSRATALRLAATMLAAAFGVVPGVVTAQDAAPWPPSEDGIVFRWENGGESNTVPGDDGIPRLCRLMPTGSARLNRHWAMELLGGSFRAEAVMSANVAAAWRAASHLTIELVITPATHGEPGGAGGDIRSIAYLATPDGGRMLLAERDATLLFGADGENAARLDLISIGRSEPGRARHVAVVVEAGSVTAYIDGDPVPARDAGSVSLSGWTEDGFLFGSVPGGPAGWRGSIEGVAVYGRTLGAEQVALHHGAYARRLATRTSPARLLVDARLTTKRGIPRATVYPDSLVVFDYRVVGVAEGAYDEEKILVVHWGNLNGERRAATQSLRVGRTYRLRLEPFDAHPELAALQLVMNDEDFHLPMFYALSDPEPLR